MHGYIIDRYIYIYILKQHVFIDVYLNSVDQKNYSPPVTLNRRGLCQPSDQSIPTTAWRAQNRIVAGEDGLKSLGGLARQRCGEPRRVQRPSIGIRKMSEVGKNQQYKYIK